MLKATPLLVGGVGEAKALLEGANTLADALTKVGLGVNLVVASGTLLSDLNHATTPEQRYDAVETFQVAVDTAVAKAVFVATAAALPEVEIAFLGGLLGTTLAVPLAPAVILALSGVALGVAASAVWDQKLEDQFKELDKQHFEQENPRNGTPPEIVQDGAISGATVFADANGNGKLDPGEASTTTDQNGNFSLDSSRGQLIAFGGTDVSTGLPFKGTLTAPPGSTAITPLTTLLNDLSSNLSAQQRTLANFGLPSTINLAAYDPVAALNAGDTNGGPVAVAGAKVYDTVAMIASALAGAGGNFSTAAADTFAGTRFSHSRLGYQPYR